MDKKAKKQIEVLRMRIEKLQKQIAGAKQQNDDPAELAQFQKELASAHEQIKQLKGE
jgi:peptidoglycan hydrolase CwlO-like protein